MKVLMLENRAYHGCGSFRFAGSIKTPELRSPSAPDPAIHVEIMRSGKTDDAVTHVDVTMSMTGGRYHNLLLSDVVYPRVVSDSTLDMAKRNVNHFLSKFGIQVDFQLNG